MVKLLFKLMEICEYKFHNKFITNSLLNMYSSMSYILGIYIFKRIIYEYCEYYN